MFQFKTAKDRPLTIVFDSKAKKIINQFEQFDKQSQEPFADERDVEVEFSIKHLQEFNFQKDSKRKRVSTDTVYYTKCYKQKVDENLPPTAQKKYPEKKVPIYHMNSLLIFKTRNMKLDPAFKKLREQIFEGCLIVKIQYRRIEDLIQELDLYFIKSYFDHNYSKVDANWLEHHGNLIAWKLISRRIYSLQRLVYELEYRYFIEYVQNQRSVIQQIVSNDVSLGVHLVLLIVQVEINLSRSILELSDGWYSIFFVSDSNPIYKKMKRGMKIHIMNMTEYPIQFNFTKSRIMSKYRFTTQIVTANLNSIRKANDVAILGRQQCPYFLRSIKSLRFGRIPCLDVVICGISYIVINQQAIKHVEEGSVINCYLRVCDNLHYFENSNPEKESFINVQISRLTLDMYDSLKCGTRIRLINVMQTHYGFICDLSRSSGIITDLTQLKGWKPKDQKDMSLIVKQYHRRKFNDLIIAEYDNKRIQIEIWNEFFAQINFNLPSLYLTNLELKPNGDYQTSVQRSLIQGASFRSNQGSPKHGDGLTPVERSVYQSEYPKNTNARARLLIPQRRKSIRNISAKIESSEELVSLNTKQKSFRQSLQKLYEDHFIKNLIDRSYTRKLDQLSNYQTQVLDDLQFGYDQEIIDTDNVLYNLISKYIDVIGVISPQSTFKLIWNIISLFTCITLYIWLPYKMAFELNFISQLFTDYAHLTIEPILITVLAGDILISCNEAYINKGIIIQQRYYIIKNYLRTEAIFDVAAISSMIYMLIEIHKQVDELERSYMSWQVCFCLYFGFYKGLKLSHILTQIQDYFNIQGNVLQVTFVIKVFLMILYVIHVIGCLWYGIGIDGWVEVAKIESTTNSFKYAVSIYWASVYLCSVGSTSYGPTNIRELFFASFVSFLSLIMIATMSITVGQFAYNFQKAQHNQVKVMKNFMLNNKIDFNLQVRIKNYLDYICNEEKSMKDEDVSDIIGRLSTKLQSELMLELRSSLLQQCTVISKQFSEKLQRQLISQMEEVQTVPEQRIIIQDEIDDSSIYMISKGEVDIVFESKNKIGQKEKRNIIKNLQKAEFFGFYGFITGFGRTATVISRGCCRLYKIPRQQFLKVLESFPNDKEIFNEMRDELSHNGDYTKLAQRCYSCKSFKHLAKGCNYLHYVPDSDRVIKQFSFPHIQERDDPIQPRTTRFINALLSQQILYQIAMQRQLDNLEDVSEHTNNVFLQEEDSTTQYSQMRSISRSMSQFSKHSQMQIPSRSIDASNFDEQVADRRPVQRKKDQKNTVETAGFGFRSSKHSSSAEDEIEELSEDDIDEEEEEQQSSESSHRQQMVNNSKYKGSSSPKVSQPSNLSKRSSVNNKVTFNSDEFQVLRNSIKRKSTKTTNTAIVVEKALQSLNEFESNIQFAILTQPSVGDFDKLTLFKFYFPQFNIQNVLKRIKNPPKEQYSLYTFILAALQKALQLRNAIEPGAKMMHKQSIFKKVK